MFVVTVMACVLMASIGKPPVCSDDAEVEVAPLFVSTQDCVRYVQREYHTRDSDPAAMWTFDYVYGIVQCISCAARV
jgi:hypothetical protein